MIPISESIMFYFQGSCVRVAQGMLFLIKEMFLVYSILFKVSNIVLKFI